MCKGQATIKDSKAAMKISNLKLAKVMNKIVEIKNSVAR